MMPSTCFRPSLAIALRAFFSLREWTVTEAPAGMDAVATMLIPSYERANSQQRRPGRARQKLQHVGMREVLGRVEQC